MKKLAFLFIIAFSLFANAQQDSSLVKKMYIKTNALFLPIGIINAGLETQLTDKITLQADVFVSPWKSFAGKYAQIYMIGFDGRYYFKEAFKNWYVGANISFARYKIQKWNYWSDTPYQYEEGAPFYITSDLYQDGFSFMIGAVVGYQFKLGENWNMDIYAGGGNSQDFYKGYHKKLGVRYDDPGRTNRSGEWMPYKGGIMISYRIK